MIAECVTIDLIGPGSGAYNFGLGNQLFQLATALSLARDNGTSVIAPQLYDPKYGAYGKIFPHNFGFLANEYGYAKNLSNNIYQEPHFHYAPIPFQPGIRLRGYFQSEKYFAHNRDYILQCLEPSTFILDSIVKKYSKIIIQPNRPCIASMHVRRGDYMGLQDHHPVLPIEYYEAAARELVIHMWKPVDEFWVFSDDPEWCRANLNIPKMRIVNGNPDYIDLYLMSFCTYNIIANSTFSWWAAWLNQLEEKVVIAPKQWFGPAKQHLDTKDLIPSPWIQI